MAKKKRYRGHFCKVCERILPNEKFSGKGHATHICKKCSKKPKDKQAEQITINRIYKCYRYWDLSWNNRRMLEEYSQSLQPRVKLAALEMLANFSR